MAAPSSKDAGFDGLARHYDKMMDFVNYERWEVTCSLLAELLPKDFLHVDFACGTGVLVERLRNRGWNSFGCDLSRAMLVAGRKQRGKLPLACADLRASPLHGRVNFATCLFDSLNFILEPEQVAMAFKELGSSLAPGGILYCDVVTERMILDHFVGPEWTERSGKMTLNWKTTYDRKTTTAETRVRINKEESRVFRERVYANDYLLQCFEDAGLELLGAYDAHGWRPIAKHSVRLDFVAVKPPAAKVKAGYAQVEEEIKNLVRAMPEVMD